MNSPLITVHEDPYQATHRSPRYASTDSPAYLNDDGLGFPVTDDLPTVREDGIDAAVPDEPPELDKNAGRADEIHGDEADGTVDPLQGRPAEEGAKVDELLTITETV